MVDTNEIEIAAPKSDEHILTSLEVSSGAPVSQLDYLKLFSADTWEDLTLELVTHWKTQYSRVVRCGAGGDKGRDVIAYSNKAPNLWENFQCKHYSNKLNLAQGLLEIAKVIHYAHLGEFTIPAHYYFVAPQGVSNDLLKHLNDPGRLKTQLLSRWDKDCKSKITTKRDDDIALTDELRAFIDTIDFSIFDHLPPIKIIELHSKTEFHAKRFGVQVKKRPRFESPPEVLSDNEVVYTNELLNAFADAEGVSEFKAASLVVGSDYKEEYDSARKNFYAAEGLEKFSRDWLPENSYDDLVEECYEAVSATVRSKYENGYVRYLETNAHATKITYDSHPLRPYIKIQDKKGMCHQLVNSSRIKWVKEESS
ncbi:ABC-three component system protein [Rheinheimera oceanensis]|uniref:ABC-three component system protein n=1 Tax=Rheinheimera oceanensis TaxID=2817449 RepID=UPI001BFD2B03|nr:ABC-three component system protein [Rheinheimera oceanensis]